MSGENITTSGTNAAEPNPAVVANTAVAGENTPGSGVTQQQTGGEGAVNSDANPTGTDGQGAGGEKQGGMKPRTREYLARINRDKYAAQREAETWKATAESLARQLQETRAKRQQTQDPSQVLQHVAADTVGEVRAEAARSAAKTAEDKAQSLEKQGWMAAVNDARERYPDFNTVVHKDLAVSPTMGSVIREIPEGADLLYYLGKNPDKAEEIYELPASFSGCGLDAVNQRTTVFEGDGSSKNLERAAAAQDLIRSKWKRCCTFGQSFHG